MAKNKKKLEKRSVTGPVSETSGNAGLNGAQRPETAPEASANSESVPAAEADATPLQAQKPPRSRWRRLFPDLVKVTLALAVTGLGAAIWFKPPLLRASFPYVSCSFKGQPLAGATLFRPLAMPTRYYIELPRQLAGRYTWFAVDRRREVAALTEAPSHRFLGRNAIKRSDPLGLDLEFRKLDNSEWRVFFLDDAILFSNAVLTVRLDTKQETPHTGK